MTPKRARPVCGYMGCTLEEYHSGLCTVAPPAHKRRAPLPRRIASESFVVPYFPAPIPLSEELSQEMVHSLFDQSLDDLLFTVEEVERCIDELPDKN